jgi:hypothetical protein
VDGVAIGEDLARAKQLILGEIGMCVCMCVCVCVCVCGVCACVLILGETGTSVELVLVRSNRRLVITARRGKIKQAPAAKTDIHATRPHTILPFTQQVLLYNIHPYIVCVCVCVCVCVYVCVCNMYIFFKKKAANWLSRTINDNLRVSSDQSSLLDVEHALHDAGCCALFSPHLPTAARVIFMYI